MGHTVGGCRPTAEVVWSKSRLSHCYGILTIEPPPHDDDDDDGGQQQEEADRPLELPQIRWRVFDGNDHAVDDVRFVR